MSKKTNIKNLIKQAQELQKQIKATVDKGTRELEAQLGLDVLLDVESTYNDQDYYNIVRLEAVGEIPFNCTLNDVEEDPDSLVEQVEEVLKQISKDVEKNKELTKDLTHLQKSFLALAVKTKKTPEEIYEILVNLLALSEFAA